jgi:bifunctional non-homologous end joining protein LigD
MARRSDGPSREDLSQYGVLAEYNRKRRFDVTPEPPAKTKSAPHTRAQRGAGAGGRKPGRPLRYVIQKHRAGHLHYDFRLEHDGAMLSWAVPKGPSLDPAVRRLAMQTEPHPMDYNHFEGVIPEGEYGGGTVMIWDHGTWEPEAAGDSEAVSRALAKGQLKFRLHGKKLRGSWVLVQTRGSRQWLLIKHRDDAASSEDLTITHPLSVVSRRTMAGIARAAGATPRQLEQAAGADPERPRAKRAG